MVQKLFNCKHEIILFLITGLLLFSGLDKVEVNIMEARNFVTAREMVHNNEYLLTTLNGEPRYQKPPLPTWLTAASGNTFGFDSLYAMRAPVALVTFLLVFAFYHCSRLLGLSSSQSFNNSLILITSFYIFFSGRDNQWDMYTHGFMLMSIFFLWKTFQKESGCFRNSLLSGLFLGFSLLSKGPVSLYALFLPFILSYIAIYKISWRKSGIYLLNMLITGLVVGFSWYAYVRLKDPGYFHAIASKEVTNWTSYETKPFYYYWNFFIQSGIWALPSLAALIYPYLKTRVSNLKAYRFSILWTILAVVFLSLIPEKKVRYLVPALIPLALTTGFYIEYLFDRYKSRLEKRERAWVSFSFGIISIVGFIFPIALLYLLKGGITDYLFIYITSSALVLLCAIFIIKGLLSNDFSNVFYSTVALFTIAVIAVFPMSGKLFLNPDFSPASKALSIEKQYNVKTYSQTDIAPEIVWDFGKPIPKIQQKVNQINLPVEKQFGLLVDTKDTSSVKSLFPKFKVVKVGRIDQNYRDNDKSRLIKEYYLISSK